MGDEAILPNPRAYVALVGFLATWWMGAVLGFVLSLVGLVHSDWKTMFTVTIKAFFVTMGLSFITGIIGLLYGHFFLTNKPKESFDNWFIPDNLIDFTSFISVGSMHNFSYLGGVIGLVAGVIYSMRQRKKRLELAIS
jgi:nitrate reductase gamma subunit